MIAHYPKEINFDTAENKMIQITKTDIKGEKCHPLPPRDHGKMLLVLLEYCA